MVVGILCGLLIASAGAATVSSPSSHIEKGDLVSIVIQDLNNNATFTLLITGTFAVTSGGNFSFEANNFQMPFSLQNSQVRASLQNTDKNVFNVKKGDTEVKRSGRSTDGSFTTVATYTISSGTYDFLRMSGTALPDEKIVIATLEMTGTKKGPNDGTISFNVDGIDSGSVEVTAKVDGSTVLSNLVIVGTAPVTETTTAVTPTPTPNYHLGGSSGGGGGSISGGSSSSTAATVNTTATSTVSPTITSPEVTDTITAATPVPEVSVSPTPEEIPVATTTATPTKTPTKAAMTVVPFLGPMVIAAFLLSRTKK
jgi:hypothetical protein